MTRLTFSMATWGMVLGMASAVYAEGLGMGSQQFQGKIDQIDRAAKTITVDPGPLQMAKEFEVKDDSQFQALKPGDEVSVQFSEQAGQSRPLAEKIDLVQAEADAGRNAPDAPPSRQY